MQNRKSNYLNILTIIIVLILSYIVISLIVININHFNYEMNADIAAETELAKAIWDYKQIVPDSWISSSETRLLNPSVIAAPIYGLTHNAILSMGVSCSLLLIIQIALLFWLCKELKLSNVASLVSCIIFMVIPGSTLNQQIICLYAAYYAIHIIAILLAMISYIRIINRSNKISIVAIICVLCTLVLSMQGMRMALVMTIPFIGMLMVREILYWCRNKKISINELSYRNTNIFGLGLLGTAVIGYFSPYSVKVDTSRNIRHAWEKFTTVVIPAFKEALSFNTENKIICIFNSVMFIIVIVYVIYAVGRYINNKQNDNILFISLFFFASLLLSAFMTTFTTTTTSSRYFFVYYLLAAIIIGYLINSCILNERDNKYHLVALISSILVILYGIASVNHYYMPVIKSNQYNEEVEQIVQLMKEHNCYYGYSSFGSSGTLTVRANNEIQISGIDDFSKMNISRWLTDENWYVPNLEENMPTAYIIHREWADTFKPTLNAHDDIELIGETMNYYIYYSDTNYSNMGE